METELTSNQNQDRQQVLNNRGLKTSDTEPESANQPDSPRQPQKPSADISRRRRTRIAAVVLILLGAIIAVPLWNYLSSYEDTDDAQVDGHIIAVSSRINGTVSHVYVIDTQTVSKGQVLLDIDPSGYVVAVEGARFFK